MTTVSINEASRQMGVTESTIRSWVLRGYVEPVRRGAKPLRFDEDAIARCAVERMSRSDHERIDALWAEVLAQT